ncbi:MAG: PAS-domain containing protein [Alphaproteobacteria bacterium]
MPERSFRLPGHQEEGNGASDRPPTRRVCQELIEAIEAIPNGFALFDKTERLVVANSRYREIFRLSAPLLVPGCRFEDHIHLCLEIGEVVVADGHVEEWIDQRLQEFRSPESSSEHPLADGRWLRFSTSRMHDDHIVCTLTDITDLVHREQRAHESERRFHAIIDTAVDAIVTFDPGGRIVDFNPAAALLFAIDRAEALGRNIADLVLPPQISPYLPDGWSETIERMDGATRNRRFESEATRADGTLFPIEMTITAVPLAGRQVFTAFLRDITDNLRAKAELDAYREHLEDQVNNRTAALKTAEERLVTAINTFKGGFALYDSSERLIIVNDNLLNLLPEVRSALTRQARLEDVTRAVANANGYAEAWVAERLRKYRSVNEFSAERELDDGRWIETSVRHTPDNSTLFILTDITQHKKAEAALRQALEREKELGQLQREFISMASHEFRTPLAIIDVSIQRLLRKRATLSEADFDMLGQEIRAAVTRMVGLMDAILHTSRLDSGTIRFTPGPCDIRATLKTVCSRQQQLTSTHLIHLDVESLPASLEADESMLDQIFTNLISNAVKYSPLGGNVTVRGTTEADHAVVTVSDEGVGIPRAELPRLFQRFFRAKTSAGISGTGIGLYIVKRLLDMHQGSIVVDSREGHGTTFTLLLPIRNMPATGYTGYKDKD